MVEQIDTKLMGTSASYTIYIYSDALPHRFRAPEVSTVDPVCLIRVSAIVDTNLCWVSRSGWQPEMAGVIINLPSLPFIGQCTTGFLKGTVTLKRVDYPNIVHYLGFIISHFYTHSNCMLKGILSDSIKMKSNSGSSLGFSTINPDILRCELPLLSLLRRWDS